MVASSYKVVWATIRFEEGLFRALFWMWAIALYSMEHYFGKVKEEGSLDVSVADTFCDTEVSLPECVC